MSDTALIAYIPAKMQGTEDLGVNAENNLCPMHGTPHTLNTETSHRLPYRVGQVLTDNIHLVTGNLSLQSNEPLALRPP